MGNALIEALSSASQDDLTAINDRIAVLEGELQELRSKLASEIDALKAARRIISVRLGAEPLRKPNKAAASSGNDRATKLQSQQRSESSPAADRVFKLLQDEGSMPLPAIAARLNTTPAAVGRIITGASVADWFEKRNGEVHIARGPSA